jgi:hypothetical protein
LNPISTNNDEGCFTASGRRLPALWDFAQYGTSRRLGLRALWDFTRPVLATEGADDGCWCALMAGGPDKGKEYRANPLPDPLI